MKFVEERKSLIEQFTEKKISPLLFSKKYSLLIDRFIRRNCENLPEDKLLITATGSYGKKRLSPNSDIDLLIFLNNSDDALEKEIVNDVIYPFWDIKLKVSYSIRNSIIFNDLKEWAKLYDLRYIFGSKKLYNQILKEFHKTEKEQFLKDLFFMNDERREKFGNTVFLLQPDIKNSPGGLRDINLIFWYLKSFKFSPLSTIELDELKDSYNFITKIRNVLHLYSNRDHLLFEFQKKLGEYFNVDEESLMKKYYFYADIVDYYYEFIREKLNPKYIIGINYNRKIDKDFYIKDYKLYVVNKLKFINNPIMILKAFDKMQKYRIFPSFELKKLIKQNIKKIEKINRDSSAIKIFFNIIERDIPSGFFLKLMNKLNFFYHFIPYFKKIKYKITYDTYHKYTVDMHSIYAVIKLRRLLNGEYLNEFPFISALALNIQNKKYLLLAALIHDIGKGIPGKESHLVKGERIAGLICKRFKISKKYTELIKFLVRHHTLMTDIALKRDIKNEEEISKFVKYVKNVKNLNYLYLLSFADVNAVSEDNFDKWKNNNFQELYIKAFTLLTKRDKSFLKLEEKIASIKSYAIDILSKKDFLKFEKFLLNFSRRFILLKDEHSIISLFNILKNAKKKPFIKIDQENPEDEIIRIIIYTYNYPGIFNRSVGVLTLNNLTILSAELYSNNDGTIVNILYAKPIYRDIYFYERFQKIENELKKYLNYKIGNDELTTLLFKKIKNVKFPLNFNFINKINFNNQDSVFFTIVEIVAPDYPGLLYEISDIFFKNNIEIHSARITTQGIRAIDTFYVTDINGNKILDKNLQEKIKEEFFYIIEKKFLTK